MWAICKSKKAKLYIRYIYEEVGYSFTRAPLTKEQVDKCLQYAPFKERTKKDTDKPEYVLDKKDCPDKYIKLKNRINQLAKSHANKSDSEKTLSGSYKSNIEGTSKLIRSADKSKIHIARRRNDINTPNCVCISDDIREEFFACVKYHRGIDTKTYCIFVQDGNDFKNWSDKIDKLFLSRK